MSKSIDGRTPSERDMSTQDSRFDPQNDEMDETHPFEEPGDDKSGADERSEKYQLRAFNEPHLLGENYIDKNARAGNVTTLSYWRGTFYKWSWDHWDELMDYEIQGPVSKFVREEFDAVLRKYPDDKIKKTARVTKHLITDVQHAIMSKVSIRATSKPPIFVDGRNTPGGLLPLANGILDIRKALEGRFKPIQAHTPKLFNLSCASYPYDPNARCPLWDEFVTKVMKNDPELIKLLQEIFGWALVADTSFQKFVILVGEGANGKGVFCAVLTALIGADNVSHVPLGMFAERFQLSNTLGKLLNIEPDAGEISRKGEAVIKSFTAGDRMNFERKFKDPVSALPTARLIIGTNSLPRFEDRSSGIWRRMILLPFQITIPEHERDRDLANKLKVELPGILNWSLEGLKRLREKGHFTEPAVCKAGLDEYRTDSNPARLFLNENYAVDPMESVECRDVYERYRGFCTANGYDSLNAAEFGKEVRRVFPQVEKKRDASGKRVYRYHGIKFVGYVEPLRLQSESDDVPLR